MAFNLSAFHKRNRIRIIEEWARRLKAEVGQLYAQRPIEELFGTVREAFELYRTIACSPCWREMEAKELWRRNSTGPDGCKA